MNDLYRVVIAERLKLRRTLALRLAIFAPLVIVLIVFGMYLGRLHSTQGAGVLAGFAQLILTIWTIIVFPLYGALVAALLAGIEHENEGWKHLFALPVERIKIFIAKWIVGLGLLLLSFLVLAASVVGTAEILRIANPAWSTLPLPTFLIFKGALLSTCAVLLLFSIQMWISIRWKSFLPGLVVAVLALAVMFIGIPRGLVLFGSLFPWSLPASAMAPHNPYYWIAMWWGFLGGVLFGAIACYRLSTREFC